MFSYFSCKCSLHHHSWLAISSYCDRFFLAALISSRSMARCRATDSVSTEMARAQKEIKVV